MRYVSRFWALALVCPSAALGITLGQVDTFQDGTTQGWTSYTSPVNYSSGGPGGSGDRFLMVSSTGVGLTGELAAFGGQRWHGDYISAGVAGVEMDLINLGTQQLDMRILFPGNYGHWTSQVPYVLPADGQWHHAAFGINTSELVEAWVGSSTELADTLRGGALILRHQSGPPQGAGYQTLIATTIGIDNVRAVPDPGTIAMAVLGGAVILRRSHRR